jgi:hypothetical protein
MLGRNQLNQNYRVLTISIGLGVTVGQEVPDAACGKA